VAHGNVAVSEVPLEARLLRGRNRRLSRSRLEQLEESDLDLPVVLAWLVSDELELPEEELNAARRRAMFVLAAGGDPHRDLDLNAVAAGRLADELDSEERRSELATALKGLNSEADGLPRVSTALESLLGDPDAAWRCLALALLADELAGD
jgi:hypothetical protein